MELGGEGGRGGGSCSHHEVPAGKRKTLKILKHCFRGGRQFAYIRFSPEVLETNPSEERGMSCKPLLELKCCFVFCTLIRISLSSPVADRY